MFAAMFVHKLFGLIASKHKSKGIDIVAAALKSHWPMEYTAMCKPHIHIYIYYVHRFLIVVVVGCICGLLCGIQWIEICAPFCTIRKQRNGLKSKTPLSLYSSSPRSFTFLGHIYWQLKTAELRPRFETILLADIATLVFRENRNHQSWIKRCHRTNPQ